jgi:hypothetical protein
MSSKKEVWKLISFQGKKPGIPYAVSNHGRFGVMDSKGHVEVRTFKPQAGGYRYNFKIDGKSKALFVYKEVAKAFLKKTSPKQTLILRKDHNYLNDNVNNLKWATPDEHKAHVTFSPKSIEARTKRAITKSYTAKVFNEKTIREVKKLIWDPKRKLTFKQIAEKFGVSEMQIYRIKTGELWFHVHVPNEPVFKKYKENLQNISFQEKKSEKENAAKAKLHAARKAAQEKTAERRAKLKAEKEKNLKLRKAKAEQKRKAQSIRSKNYQLRLEKSKKKREEKEKRKAERLSKKARKKQNKKAHKKEKRAKKNKKKH